VLGVSGKADEHKDPPLSAETHPIQTSTDEKHDSSAETPPVLSIFLVNDLQYDIFPVHLENGSRCDTDPGNYPSMGFDVQMAMRIEVSSLGM
jgi:hypothetical protein